MVRTDLPYTRTLTLTLSESDWMALRDIEPDAVGWLQTQIRNRLTTEDAPRQPRPSAFAFHDDEY